MTLSKDVIAAAQAARAKWGVPASVTIAQYALESGWGAHMPGGPSSCNPFGIKAVAGQPAVDAMTAEVIGGRTVHLDQRFRRFADIAQAFDLHGMLLHNGRPYAHAMELAGNADAFAHALTGVYATDPNYGAKLIGIMHAHNLYQYDKAA